MAGDDRKAVDALLGSGWYDSAQGLLADSQQELATYAALSAKMDRLASIDNIWWEMKDLREFAATYEDGIDKLGNGRRLKKEEFEALHDLVSDLESLAELNNELLGKLFAAGLLDAITLIGRTSYSVLMRRAEDLQTAMRALAAQLQKAKTQRNESILQGAINVLVMVAVPELGLFVGVAKYLGGMALDNLLGPDKSAALDGTGNVVGAFSTFAQSADKIESFGVWNGMRAKRIGGITDKLGPVFDGIEIYQAARNVSEIQSAISKVKSEHRALMVLVKKALPGMIRFRQAVMALQVQTKKNRDEANVLRAEIRSEITKWQSVTGGTPWRELPAPAPVAGG